ncbi:MFS transporter [Halobacteria archaeon AArc-m2/3/4]|uniref:MFS transporter n=1 Tax=Natronoglomus mannanivorans TaxID=2979990 RepID=A0ABT2QEE2_9EURY|nr:MFS transporter [Halobacteria archaeon AArc-m2/3/4]
MGADTEVDAESDAGSESIPWRSSALYVILSSSLMGVMGVSLISPVLPELRAAFELSDAQVGLVITVYTLPGVFLTPFIGLLADRIGRRRVIIPLLFIFGIGGAGIAFASSFTEVLALRFLQGIGASALVTLAVTLIGDFYDGAQRNAVMGFNGSMLGTGAALYPLVGGALGGIRWSVPFLFFGIGIFVGIVAAVALEEPEADPPSSVGVYLGRLRDVAVLPEAIAIFSAIFVVFFVFYGAVQTALPLLMSDEFDLSSSQIGLILAMVSVASATVSSLYGRISQWRTAPELVALGFVAYGTSLLGVWLAPSPVFVGVSLLAFGVGFGIVMPSIDTTVVTLVSSELRAGMMGMRTSMLRLGQTLGPVAFTFIADAGFETSSGGYRVLLVVSGVIVLLSGVGGYLLLRR